MAEARPEPGRMPTLWDIHTAMQRDVSDFARINDSIVRMKADERRYEVERQQTMIRELAAMRRELQLANEDTAGAVERANAAEADKIAAQERHERQQRLYLRVAIGGLALSAVTTATTVAALLY
jgi:hypothetical protein